MPAGSMPGAIPIALSQVNGTFDGVRADDGDIGSSVTDFAAEVSTVKPITGDFNGDGYGDFALIGDPNWSFIPVAMNFASNGNFIGDFRTSFGTDNGVHAYYYAGIQEVAGDFNGDGRSDIAFVGNSGWTSIPIAMSNGDGSFTQWNSAGQDGGFHAYYQPGFKAIAGDFNCDGLADIALVGPTSWQSIPVAYSNGDGTFKVTNGNDGGFNAYFNNSSTVHAVSLGGCPAKIALIGGSGWTTIPVATPDISSSLGAFTVATPSDGGFNAFYWATNIFQVVAGDFNGDGYGDILLTGTGNWNAFPTAYQNPNPGGAFSMTTGVVTSGDSSFPQDAALSGAKVLTE